jgi:hypothetical protein
MRAVRLPRLVIVGFIIAAGRFAENFDNSFLEEMH